MPIVKACAKLTPDFTTIKYCCFRIRFAKVYILIWKNLESSTVRKCLDSWRKTNCRGRKRTFWFPSYSHKRVFYDIIPSYSQKRGFMIKFLHIPKNMNLRSYSFIFPHMRFYDIIPLYSRKRDFMVLFHHIPQSDFMILFPHITTKWLYDIIPSYYHKRDFMI